MDQKKIGKFIQDARKKQNITQKDLAEKLGVTDKTISRWENGHYLPDISLWKDLCETLNISILELLNGENYTNKKVSEKEMEESIFNTVKITHNEMKKLKNKTIIIILILILLIISIISGSIYQINNVKKKSNEIMELNYVTNYASIEKEDGWVCYFLTEDYNKNSIKNYYQYNCINLKYKKLDGYYSFGTEADKNGEYTYQIEVPYISYIWNNKYSSDIRNIDKYFYEKQFNDTITLKDLEDLEIESDIDKVEILNLYNKSVMIKIKETGKYVDYQPVQVIESMIIDDYQWIFGYHQQHGKLVNLYLDIKYKNQWLSDTKDRSEEQNKILDEIPKIKNYILSKQDFKLSPNYSNDHIYIGLISLLDNIKKNGL